jgi:small-conductance mechanosensitive channel
VRLKKFKAKCPYKIGDRIRFEKGGKENVMEITDVLTQISAKSSEVTFILELDGWYMLNTKLHEVKIPEKPQKH